MINMQQLATTTLTLALDPQGEVYVLQGGENIFSEFCANLDVITRIQNAFAEGGAGHGLLHLGSRELQTPLPSVASFGIVWGVFVFIWPKIKMMLNSPLHFLLHIQPEFLIKILAANLSEN